jgi:hypothetical protein
MKKDFSTYAKLQRQLFRQNVHVIWQMIKTGRVDELSAGEQKLAEIIMHHEEYADHFENTEILDGSEYEAGAEFNPFFHISIHQMVEDQLSLNTPIETTKYCEAMESKGISRHDAIHNIMVILVHVLYDSASTGKPFDSIRYRQLLNECQELDPSEQDRVIKRDVSTRQNRQGHN